MNLEEYEATIIEHRGYLFRMKLYVENSRKLFKDFPNNIDIISREQWKKQLKEIESLLSSSIEDKYSIETSEKFDSMSSESLGILMLFASKVYRGVKKYSFDDVLNFNEIIYHQALVMNYARIDAFFNDSIKCICEKQPSIMLRSIEGTSKKNQEVNERKIDLKEIIKLGSYEKIIDYISDDFIYKLGLKSIKDRISYLNDKLGFNISKEEVDLQFIYEGEQYRHCIVHRGGVIDNKLADTLKKEGIEPSTKLELDIEYLRNIFIESEALINCISDEIKEKFFKDE